MSSTRASHGSPLTPAQVQQVDEACDRFEAACKIVEDGPVPRIEAYLDPCTNLVRSTLLRELVLVEVHYRRRRGEPCTPEDYLARFPELGLEWIGEALAQSPPAAAPPSSASETASDSRAGGADASRRQHLRCPHCHDLIRLADRNPDEVLCPGCGSGFRMCDARLTATADAMRIVGKFQLLERIGLGAFGAVWRARDTELDRVVALKIPHANLLTSPNELARFQREARAAAQLRHPNIVTVHEVVMLEELPAIVSDYVAGVPLRDLLEVRRPTFRESAELAAEVAEALDYAHGMGVVHRDVKPANIMVEYGRATTADGGPAQSKIGRPLLLDFGLALRTDAEITMTMDGHIVGTPAYMSPEQAAGKGHHADGRSDVFSLGVVLYEMLSGELPFRGSKAMLLMQVITDEPRAPRSLNNHIPRDLEVICLKAMAKSPERRYASGREFADDLRRFLRGDPIKARPVGAWERTVNWARRRPAIAALLALTVLITVVAFGLVTWQWQRAEKQWQRAEDIAAAESKARSDAEEAKAAADKAQHDAEEKSREAQRQSASLALERGVKLCEEGDTAQGLLWLARSLVEVVPSRAVHLEQLIRINLSRWSWQHLPLKRQLSHRKDGVHAVAYSADGKQLLTGGQDGLAQVWDAATGKLARFRQHPRAVRAVAFSPLGGRVITGCDDGIARVWDIATGEVLHSLSGHQKAIRVVAFSPDGRLMATGGEDGTTRLWEASSGKAFGKPLAQPPSVFALAFSPDGKLLVTGGQDVPRLRIWDVKSGNRIKHLDDHQGNHSRTDTPWGSALAVSFSPDGGTVAAGYESFGAQLWNVATGKPSGTVLNHDSWVFALAFSPDGQTILTGSRDGTALLWRSATQKPIGSPLKHQTSVRAVAFSPDGQTVLTGSEDSSARLWEVVPGEPSALQLRHQRTQVACVAISPDGTVALTGGDDNTARLWDLKTGKEIAALPHSALVRTVAFSSDGKTFVTGDDGGKVQFWKTATREPIPPLIQHPSELQAIALSPDGKTVATGGGAFGGFPAVHLWDTVTGKRLPISLKHANRIHTIVFSSDGRTILTSSEDSTARLWDATTGKELHLLQHQNAVYAAAFQPDDRAVLTGDFNSTAQLWDTRTGKAFGPRFRHQGAVMSGAFSHDGRTVLTGSLDGTARLWDTSTGKPLGPSLRHPRSIRAVALSPDKNWFLTGCDDGIARLWPFPASATATPEQITLWCRLATNLELDQDHVIRTLDAPTWQQYADRLQALGGPPSSFQRPADQMLAWHQRMAEECAASGNSLGTLWHLERLPPGERDTAANQRRLGFACLELKRWDEAIPAFSRVVAQKPNDKDAWWGRGKANAELSRWDKAVVDYEQAIKLGRDDIYVRQAFVLLCAGIGDVKRYQLACEELLRRIEQKEESPEVPYMALSCLILRGGLVDLKTILRLGERGVAKEPTFCRYYHLFGPALFRTGKNKEAIHNLSQAVRFHRGVGSLADVFFLAMAHQGLGEKEVAKKLLDQAILRMDRAGQSSPAGTNLDSPSTWDDRLVWVLLRREAEAMIYGKPVIPAKK